MVADPALPQLLIVGPPTASRRCLQVLDVLAWARDRGRPIGTEGIATRLYGGASQADCHAITQIILRLRRWGVPIMTYGGRGGQKALFWLSCRVQVFDGGPIY